MSLTRPHGPRAEISINVRPTATHVTTWPRSRRWPRWSRCLFGPPEGTVSWTPSRDLLRAAQSRCRYLTVLDNDVTGVTVKCHQVRLRTARLYTDIGRSSWWPAYIGWAAALPPVRSDRRRLLQMNLSTRSHRFVGPPERKSSTSYIIQSRLHTHNYSIQFGNEWKTY